MWEFVLRFEVMFGVEEIGEGVELEEFGYFERIESNICYIRAYMFRRDISFSSWFLVRGVEYVRIAGWLKDICC